MSLKKLFRRGRTPELAPPPVAHAPPLTLQVTWPQIVASNDDQAVLGFLEAHKREPFVDCSISPLSAAGAADRLELVHILLEAKQKQRPEMKDFLETMNSNPKRKFEILEALLGGGLCLTQDHRAANLLHDLLPSNPPPSLVHKICVSLGTLGWRIPAILTTENQNRETPLFIACRMNQTEIAIILIGMNAYVATANTDGVSALHHAVHNGNAVLVAALLNVDPSPLFTPALPSAPAPFTGVSPFKLVGPATSETVIAAIQGASGKMKTHAPLLPSNIWSFGSNTWGQTDAVRKLDKECEVHRPLVVVQDEEVQQVACGYFHTLVLLKSGAVVAYGKGGEGQLSVNVPGNAELMFFIDFLTDLIVTAIACGKYHSAALLADGRVVCWGQAYGTAGQTLTLSESVVRFHALLPLRVEVDQVTYFDYV